MQVTRLLIPSNHQSSGWKNRFYVLGEDNPECLTFLISLEMTFMLPTIQSCGLGVSSAWCMCRMELMGENRGKELTMELQVMGLYCSTASC